MLHHREAITLKLGLLSMRVTHYIIALDQSNATLQTKGGRICILTLKINYCIFINQIIILFSSKTNSCQLIFLTVIHLLCNNNCNVLIDKTEVII